MQLIDLDADDLLRTLADNDLDSKPKDAEDELVGPDSEDELTDIDWQERDDEEDDVSSESVDVHVQIDSDSSVDEEDYDHSVGDTNVDVNVDTDDLADGIDRLIKQNSDNNELLESIDDTLNDQFEADERQRRKDDIVTDVDSPFTQLLADDFEPDQNNSDSGGGLLGGLSDMIGGPGGDGKDKAAPKKKTKPPRKGWKNRLKGMKFSKGGIATAIVGTVLTGFALDSVIGKVDKDSGLGDLVGDEKDVMTASNAEKHTPIVADAVKNSDDITVESTKEHIAPLETADFDSDSLHNTREDKLLEQLMPAEERLVSINERIQNIETATITTPSDNEGIQNAAMAAGAVGLGYMGVKSILPKAAPPILQTTEKASDVLSVAKAGTPAAAKAASKLPLVGHVINTAMLGASIVDQRSQEYESEDEKNRDTSRLVGSWGAETASMFAGAQAGAALGGAIGSVVPVLGNAIGIGVGGLVGGVVGYFAAAETGFSDWVGDRAADIYDVTSSVVSSAGDMLDSVTNFFTSEESANEEVNQTQIAALESVKDDIEEISKEKEGGLFAGASSIASSISNFFGAGDSSSSEVTSAATDYKIHSDNNIVYKIEPPEDTPQPASREDIAAAMNSVVTNVTQAAAPKAPVATPVVKPVPKAPDSNSYSAARPTLHNTPVIIDDPNLNLIHMGYL